ncbi:gamma-glutamyl-gamma-aminobutyrate hydrolase family protein [Amphritea sp. 1_MG-2023]|nr:gamma-glutamyl-gamma-aminobutyrate hydrolase family protein [Amphritea sp. 1_MG-2023]MDO6565245.1 gamma-glutamyl-gamma-aminobutyrate hydrolase family protein [Amphritea sp. 1_MG-2023]
MPILGVCFGHQLLVHVLGGTVGQNPNGAEFGVVDLMKHQAANHDPLFKDFPDIMSMYVFHYESVLQLPSDAVVLASNSHDPYQAFRYGQNIWGVQFHPEFDSEIMEHAIDVYGCAMKDANYDLTHLRQNNVDSGQGHTLLRRFIKAAYA